MTKQRERLMGCTIYTLIVSMPVALEQEGLLYTYTGVGLSALLVSTYRAMRRPLDRGTGD